MYIEAMEEVLSGNNKVLIDAKNNGNLLYLPLDKMITPSAAVPTSDDSGITSTTHLDTGALQRSTGLPVSGRPSREDRVRQGRE